MDIGRRIYEQNCAECHGAEGLGDGPKALPEKRQLLDLTLHVTFHPPAILYLFIRKGIKSASPPPLDMPAFEGKLTSEEVWHVINYLSTLVPQKQ